MRRLGLAALLGLIALGVGVLAEPQSASAQMYRWTDEQGESHFTQGIESVPLRFRPRAVMMGDNMQPPGGGPSVRAATGEAAPPGGARIPFTPGQKIMVEVRVNGRGPARLLLDTGADGTLINPAVLSALGVSYRGARPGRGKGIGGTIDAYLVRVESIEVGQAKYGPLMVISHDMGWGLDYDGLLGRDFLDNFTITIDNGAAVLVLTPKRAP